MFGHLLVDAAFAAAAGSVVMYALSLRTSGGSRVRFGRYLYLLSVVLVLSISAHHLVNILTHQFQYTYVWSYSSRDLPLPLLISTFYAGQEGSFLLWTLFTALIGVFLLRSTERSGYEREVMGVYGMIQATLLLMLILKSPFAHVWESFSGDVQPGFIPADGRGLNPLLQNYWMVIHPQVLFSGFASMSVPYAFAIAALIKREYTQWIRPATPWLAFGALSLGTGIIMGGFWAYETLGWGGYWGWDPVENSSLVPWIVSIAALHGILSQRKSGAFVRTNLVLGMLCFLFVLYSTFLTRSGVLGDTSVHSFVDPGMLIYWFLVGMIVLFAALGGVALFLRRKELPRIKATSNYFSREFVLFLGASTLMIAAILIAVGTSAPVITELLEGKKSAVEISYYARTSVPLGILIAVLAGLGQLLWWTRFEGREFLKGLIPPAVMAAVATTVVYVLAGGDQVLIVILAGAAFFALFVNLQVGSRIVRGNPKYAGGAVAHVGLAVMLLGALSSSVYDSTETIALPKGRPAATQGYTLTYLGYHLGERERYHFNVQVDREGRSRVIAPVMFTSTYSEGVMKNPDIANFWTRDLYLAPLSLEDNSVADLGQLTLRKGGSGKVGPLTVTMAGFDFPEHERAGMMEGKQARIGVKLQVRSADLGPAEVVPAKVFGGSGAADVPAKFGDRYEFTVLRMGQEASGGEFSVDIGVRELKTQPGPEVLMVEASVKPFINLVWTGVILMLIGFVITIVRRTQEARMKSPGVAPADPGE
jgi:cytochrome c-type biogenesis protein CcmF